MRSLYVNALRVWAAFMVAEAASARPQQRQNVGALMVTNASTSLDKSMNLTEPIRNGSVTLAPMSSSYNSNTKAYQVAFRGFSGGGRNRKRQRKVKYKSERRRLRTKPPTGSTDGRATLLKKTQTTPTTRRVKNLLKQSRTTSTTGKVKKTPPRLNMFQNDNNFKGNDFAHQPRGRQSENVEGFETNWYNAQYSQQNSPDQSLKEILMYSSTEPFMAQTAVRLCLRIADPVHC